jgi:hypothetical protein
MGRKLARGRPVGFFSQLPPRHLHEKLVDELERMRDFDLGLGTRLTFSSNQHQGSHKVWGTQLDEAGYCQPIDQE